MMDPVRLESRYGAKNYAPMPVVLARGEGVYVWDDKGQRYLDLLLGYSAVSFGHFHPRLVRALVEQAQRLDVTSRAFYNDKLGLFMARACQLTGMDAALPINTGAEAVETALKAARKWAYKVKGVAHDKAEIIGAEGNFHGRTIAGNGLSTVAQYRDGFGPFPAGLKVVPFGDAQALEAAITPNTAAFLVEPIQGEGGIIVPPPGYFSAVQKICRKHNVLLICDEVQSGMGRTGRLLACQHECIQPDALTLGKAVGGGLIPVSLFLARHEVMNVLNHGSTFGGNPIAAAVGLAAFDTLIDEGLIERSAELGDYMMAELKALRSPAIREVRGRGLFVGIELEPERANAHEVVSLLLEQQHILSKETHHNTLRMAPPFVITKAQIDDAVAGLAAVLEDNPVALRPALVK